MAIKPHSIKLVVSVVNMKIMVLNMMNVISIITL